MEKYNGRSYEEFKILFGITYAPIAQQLKLQNAQVPKAKVMQFQKTADAISRLWYLSFITTKQANKMRDRLFKQINLSRKQWVT